MPRQAVINAIELLQSELDLHDIWRVKNPTKRSYTWSQSNPLIFSRLDYWLTSNSLSDNVCHVDMISAIKTDHSAKVIELQDMYFLSVRRYLVSFIILRHLSDTHA